MPRYDPFRTPEPAFDQANQGGLANWAYRLIFFGANWPATRCGIRVTLPAVGLNESGDLWWSCCKDGRLLSQGHGPGCHRGSTTIDTRGNAYRLRDKAKARLIREPEVEDNP